MSNKVLDVLDTNNQNIKNVVLEDDTLEITLTDSEVKLLNCYFQSDAERAIWWEDNIDDLIVRQ
jgi:hypothetical protein